jgi:hypothetical protein
MAGVEFEEDKVMDMARFFFNSDTITLNLLPVDIAGLALTLGKHFYFLSLSQTTLTQACYPCCI